MGHDLRTQLEHLYRAGTTPELVTVPPLRCVMIDGVGDPNTSPDYSDAVGTLYAASYGARFAVKRAGGEPWRVMPLEGLWWADDLSVFTSGGDRGEWRWTMFIVQPEVVTQTMVDDVLAVAANRGKAPAADRLRLETVDEGRAMQVLHVGPYAAEGPTIAGLHEAIVARGLALRGHHHEIYLGDPRRTAPERLRTILRQPVAPV